MTEINAGITCMTETENAGNAMHRVLHILGGTDLGGAESRIMDLYRNMDRKAVQFDFLVHMDAEAYEAAVKAGKDPAEVRKPQFYDSEIHALGGSIYVLPRFRGSNYMQYRRACREFFAEHHDYTVAEGHMTSTASIYLPIAKSAGIKVTAAHARSAGTDAGFKGTVTRILRSSLWRKSDVLFACSGMAGQSTFGAHPAYYIPNAINIERFRYDSGRAEDIRRELGAEGMKVIGHVGRFHYAKNHEYLLEIFREIHTRDQNTVLLLLGDGPLMDSVKEKACSLGLEDSVRFTGNIADPAPYYSVMDFFLFPSRYEGLPGTVVEALCSGLPCLISDTIANEVVCTPYIRTMSIEHEPAAWAEEVLSVLGGDYRAQRNINATSAAGLMRAAGFDAAALAATMQGFYSTGNISNLKRIG